MKSPMKIAEESLKGWKAVEEIPVDSAPLPRADNVGVDIVSLKEKYFGDSRPRGSDVGAGRATHPTDSEDAALVVMEREGSHDFAPGRKTVVVQGNRVVGTQG